ncbi:PAS domain-containing sensor histidine kinase [Geothrix sp. 21YS21S-2]|uniref:hybrid sensor histidine kinase/response regulator n=1 Tax=Geothrix sp. 21YS21S-2 TaxID=3068893 RepID=UPI0027B8A252|nr:ATP-binding protein [Geothrix sp. 21YS21S-2]
MPARIGREAMRERIIGLGEESGRKSFYPELQQRLQQLEEVRERLRVSQENLLSVFNSIHDAILIHDRQGIVLEANQSATLMFGLPREALLGQSVYGLSIPDPERGAPEAAMQGLLAHLDQEGFAVFELRAVKPDGSPPFDVEVAVKPATWYGQDVLAAVVRDITGRKQAEGILRQAQKLDSLGQLAGGVAHDTNNMLSVIIGYSDLLLEDPAFAEGPVRQHLNQIRKAATHSSDLTRQLLAFARKQTIEPRPVDMNALVDETQAMLRRLIGENHALVWKPATTLWTVWIDPSQVGQVLVNLVVNARDAILDAGTILLETGNQVVDEAFAQRHLDARPGDYVVLSVTDTGQGMDPEILSHIFEPFFTTKEVGKGTGLGLAMVYGILRQNGGFVSVDSTPGQGSTFRLHLPRFQFPGGGQQPEASEAPAPGGWETILLVEDEEALLDLGRTVLEDAGYQVLAFPRPAQALACLAREDRGIHALVTDLVMPGMGGVALSRIVLRHRPGVKVLFMSGYPLETHDGRDTLPPSARFLQKPFSRRDLLENLRAALDGGK